MSLLKSLFGRAKAKQSTPSLFDAAIEGDLALVTKILEETPGALNKRDLGGDTALIYAAEKGHVRIVALLLKKGADTSCRDVHGNTAEMMALKGGHMKAAAMLKRHNARLKLQATRQPL